MNHLFVENAPIEGAQTVSTFPGYMVNGRIANIYRLVQRPDGYQFVEVIATNKDFTSGQIFQISCETLERLKTERIIQRRKLYVGNNGYVTWHPTNENPVCLHQYIMRWTGNGRGQDSVDHINRQKMDNRHDATEDNLRITTQSVQNYNRTLTHTEMAADLVAAVQAIDPTQISKPEQRTAFLAYSYLFVNGALGFVPSFPPNMYRTIEEAKRKDFIIIQDHPAMREPGWLGCKTLDGQPKPSSTIWTSNKTLETSLISKFLLALEVYHHLDLHGQVPEAIRNFRTPRGNVQRDDADYPATATHIVWNSSVTTPSKNKYSIEATHPLSGGTRWCCSGSTAFTWREKLFLTIEELERRASERNVPFIFPSFASRQRPMPELQAQYRDWKALKTAPTSTNPVDLRKQQIKAAGYLKRSANHQAKQQEATRIALEYSGGKMAQLSKEKMAEIMAQRSNRPPVNH